MTTERKHRKDILRFGKMIHERGFIAATDGNLSVRLGKNRILTTPTAMCKGMMQNCDLVVCDLDGNRVPDGGTSPAKSPCTCSFTGCGRT